MYSFLVQNNGHGPSVILRILPKKRKKKTIIYTARSTAASSNKSATNASSQPSKSGCPMA
jgi:hypothetical protein